MILKRKKTVRKAKENACNICALLVNRYPKKLISCFCCVKYDNGQSDRFYVMTCIMRVIEVKLLYFWRLWSWYVWIGCVMIFRINILGSYQWRSWDKTLLLLSEYINFAQIVHRKQKVQVFNFDYPTRKSNVPWFTTLKYVCQ